MSFTGWHGVFVSFVILNDVTQPPQTHTPDHKVYFGLKVVYFCSIPESFTPSICPVLFCGALCQDPRTKISTVGLLFSSGNAKADAELTEVFNDLQREHVE